MLQPGGLHQRNSGACSCSDVMVVVNDGSCDTSLSIIQRYAAVHPDKIVVID